MAPRDGRRAMRAAGWILSIAFAIVGLVVAFGVWSVGYSARSPPTRESPDRSVTTSAAEPVET